MPLPGRRRPSHSGYGVHQQMTDAAELGLLEYVWVTATEARSSTDATPIHTRPRHTRSGHQQAARGPYGSLGPGTVCNWWSSPATSWHSLRLAAVYPGVCFGAIKLGRRNVQIRNPRQVSASTGISRSLGYTPAACPPTPLLYLAYGLEASWSRPELLYIKSTRKEQTLRFATLLKGKSELLRFY